MFNFVKRLKEDRGPAMPLGEDRKNRILERLLQEPKAKEIAQQLDADALAKRGEWVAEIQAARQEIATKIPAADLAIVEETEKLRIDEARIVERRRRLDELVHARLECAFAPEQKIARAEHLLRRSADPRIAEFIAELDERVQNLSLAVAITEARGENFLGGRWVSWYSNSAKIANQLNELRALRNEAEELKLAAGDIGESFKALCARMPAEDTSLEYSRIYPPAPQVSKSPIYSAAKGE